MIWRFKTHGKISEKEEERVEEKAEKLVAYTFLILAAYVFYESIRKLYLQEIPNPSLLGIIIALISLIAMPLLFYEKYRTGKAMSSRSLIADSKETLVCAFLSLALLIGLGLNYLFGLWQADPVVGTVIVGFLLREGYSTLKGKNDAVSDTF